VLVLNRCALRLGDGSAPAAQVGTYVSTASVADTSSEAYGNVSIMLLSFVRDVTRACARIVEVQGRLQA
jgi:hypothetical protein